jgi:twitching motility protein PilJ
LLTLALFGVESWIIWNIYQEFRDTITKQFRLQELSKETVYYDEALTASANMAVSTGDLKWVERYNNFVPQLDAAIDEIIQNSPQAAADFAQTKEATDKLYELEDQAFELLRQGNRADAAKILFGKEYAEQKQIYIRGVEKTLDNLKTSIDKGIQSYKQGLFWSLVFASISLPLLMLAWVIILSAIRTYIQERNKAQKELMESQASLQQLNEELEERVEQRTQQLAEQEQAIREESEILQADVGKLLHIVSLVEEGNLTVEAPVSERVTGLVADTFNRLVEELAKVLGQVVEASRQVFKSASSLEQIANTVAANADRQAQSVTQVLKLTEQVEKATAEATKQLQISNHSLLTLNQTVKDGQGAIITLNQGTEILRQGTNRIVQQMKTLGEFMGLAEKFVQDQGEIASQTQVLALNASLVAARAAEQQNPKQFAMAAKEFEAIANQVSKLAQQTDSGLAVLEQRTTQIHNVVAAVDAEVQNLAGLVGGFTQGVEQSTQSFDNVQAIATNAVQTVETVAQSSQEIISAVQSTATAMKNIAELAQGTARITQNGSIQSEAMGKLSAQLLQRVEFFRLPAAVLPQSEPQKPVDLCQAEESTIDLSSIVT